MGASGIHFEMHEIFLANLFFAVCKNLTYKNGYFSALPQISEKQKTVEILEGEAENYFIINLLRISRLFLISVVGRPLSTCRLTFSAFMHELRLVNGCHLLFYEPLPKRDVDKSVLRKARLIS